MKHLVELAGYLFLIIFAVGFFVYFLVPQQTNAINDFKCRAEEYLGTDDFIMSMEDILIARTKDGRQYPPREVVNAYYRNRLAIYGSLGLAILLIILVVVYCQWRGYYSLS